MLSLPLNSSGPTAMAHQFSYPPNLPVPMDDGACSHLEGQLVPNDVRLTVTFPTSPRDAGYSDMPNELSIAELSNKGVVFVFIYPRTAPPEENVPEEWNAIPGARGCTPQNCKHFADMQLGLARGLNHL